MGHERRNRTMSDNETVIQPTWDGAPGGPPGRAPDPLPDPLRDMSEYLKGTAETLAGRELIETALAFGEDHAMQCRLQKLRREARVIALDMEEAIESAGPGAASTEAREKALKRVYAVAGQLHRAREEWGG